MESNTICNVRLLIPLYCTSQY